MPTSKRTRSRDTAALSSSHRSEGIESSRAAELAQYLRRAESLAIVCHDDPDPDSIASAVALGAIGSWAGVSTIEYVDGTRLSHPQNRALVQYLGIHLRPVTGPGVARADVLALVDHAIPGVHNSLHPGTPVDVVFDHHEYDRPVEGTFVDVRPDAGATATMLVEYLFALGVPISTHLASALLFALHRERLDNVRHPTLREYEAAAALYPLSDPGAIDRLYRSGTTNATIDTLASAIENRVVTDCCLVSWTDVVEETTALPQAADYLLNLQDVDTVLVVGLVDDALQMSARSIDPAVDLGEILPRVVGPDARAGGHRDMAGATVQTFSVPGVRDPASVGAHVERLTSRFCAAVAAATSGE